MLHSCELRFPPGFEAMDSERVLILIAHPPAGLASGCRASIGCRSPLETSGLRRWDCRVSRGYGLVDLGGLGAVCQARSVGAPRAPGVALQRVRQPSGAHLPVLGLPPPARHHPVAHPPPGERPDPMVDGRRQRRVQQCVPQARAHEPFRVAQLGSAGWLDEEHRDRASSAPGDGRHVHAQVRLPRLVPGALVRAASRLDQAKNGEPGGQSEREAKSRVTDGGGVPPARSDGGGKRIQ